MAARADVEAVVLLHGMGRSWLSMALLGHRLSRDGYEVHLFGYSSRQASLDELTRALKRTIIEKVQTSKYHLVGHSLGNIIVRNGFAGGYRQGLGRVVMLAPPNGPAALASRLRYSRLYRFWTGDSGQKLADESFYRTLATPTVPFGIIAGDKGHRLTFDEPNDGVVRVANTRLAGMTDWIVVHHTHTFIMLAADTHAYALHFLRHGRFADGPSDRSRAALSASVGS